MYDALPKLEKTFDFSYTGENTGLEYQGVFTVRCVLNIGQKHSIEIEESRLMADNRNPTAGLANIATALAELHGRIVEGPAWWKDSKSAADILDEGLIYAILSKCWEAEDDWKAGLKKKAEEAVAKNV